jgi:hypothetical protein
VQGMLAVLERATQFLKADKTATPTQQQEYIRHVAIIISPTSFCKFKIYSL